MKKSTSNFLVGMIVGAAAGAVAGILFAPDKGSETRKKIKEKSDELKDDIEKSFNDIKSHIIKATEDIGDAETKTPPKKSKKAKKEE